ncbi:hypothetical protein BS333_14305 [Vibrio azureus]|uniref:Uncharacterized protein n=1 Tax=Vibrio azureus NBRC 104587 TaxID=1219077 RepID=U3C7X3_9VIBR|nr:hypothetical protein [Vibrio azureus]AUI87585.1 hypothetical protein BS333_14305 [Vibrio azureus]GAD74558.1 hypothetical protein VAZ01S_012_00380 [Vibrio azureus NBRC 104587]
MRISDKATIDNLPCFIKIEPVEKPNNTLYNFLVCTSAVIGLVGVITLFLGPDTIYYDRNDGPTLLQLIQIFPGPIASVGIALHQLFSHVVNVRHSKYLDEIDAKIKSSIDIYDNDLPSGYKISVDVTEQDFVYKCSLKLKEESSEQQEQVINE